MVVPLMEGSGMTCHIPHDIICGGCGEVLVRRCIYMAAWRVMPDGEMWLSGIHSAGSADEVLHHCPADLSLAYALLVLRDSDDVAAMERSIPPSA